MVVNAALQRSLLLPAHTQFRPRILQGRIMHPFELVGFERV